jgi:hypothetical protein
VSSQASISPWQDAWAAAPRIHEYEGVDRRRFETDIQPAAQPAVLRGLVRDWPAVRAAGESREAIVALLRRCATDEPANVFEAPPEIGGRYFYSEDLLGFNFERRQWPLNQLLDRLLEEAGSERPVGLYAGGVPIPKCVPGLQRDHRHGLLDEGTEQLVSLWLGNRSRTAAHFDLPQNLAAVVSGPRRFIVLPTEQLPNLYLGPLDRTLAGQPISLVDFIDPDLEAHPRFEEARRHARVAELTPGDVLYLPSMWFHHVECEDPLGVMINFWWRDAPEHLFTPMITLFHSLLSLKGMPRRERQAWRVLFDHYVFEEGGDPMAHIPPEARGFFGDLRPEQIQRLRQYLARSLGVR